MLPLNCTIGNHIIRGASKNHMIYEKLIVKFPLKAESLSFDVIFIFMLL